MGVMTMAIGSSLINTYAQNKSLEAQARANAQTAKNIITTMNYSMQNYEQERYDAFEATIAELEKINLQGNRQVTSVEAAVNEGLMGGGRTADMIKRSSQADVNRAVSASKTNYEKKSNEIDLNKEATLLNTRQQLASIQQVQKPSILSTLINLGANYYQAKQTLDSIDLIRTKAGVNDKNEETYDTLWGDALLNNPSVHYTFSNIDTYKYATDKGGYF